MSVWTILPNWEHPLWSGYPFLNSIIHVHLKKSTILNKKFIINIPYESPCGDICHSTGVHDETEIQNNILALAGILANDVKLYRRAKNNKGGTITM